MAVIRNERSGREAKLRSRNLVGRSPAADIELSGRGASNEHASIVWDGSHWILRDLMSRNGTKVNGRRSSEPSVRLCPGDEIVFGDPQERWTWSDGAPPSALAIGPQGALVEASNGLLLLPDADAPRASISLHRGEWLLEQDGDISVIVDGALIVLDGREYTLHLPSPDPTSSLTRTIEGSAPDGPRISFEVSLDEEHVVATLHTPSLSRKLPARSHNYMLLTLARIRSADQSNGVVIAEAGWVHTRDLARMLNTSVDTLNVEIHRLRHAVGELGVLDDDTSIIERRRGTGRMRLGIANISA